MVTTSLGHSPRHADKSNRHEGQTGEAGTNTNITTTGNPAGVHPDTVNVSTLLPLVAQNDEDVACHSPHRRRDIHGCGSSSNSTSDSNSGNTRMEWLSSSAFYEAVLQRLLTRAARAPPTTAVTSTSRMTSGPSPKPSSPAWVANPELPPLMAAAVAQGCGEEAGPRGIAAPSVDLFLRYLGNGDRTASLRAVEKIANAPAEPFPCLGRTDSMTAAMQHAASVFGPVFCAVGARRYALTPGTGIIKSDYDAQTEMETPPSGRERGSASEGSKRDMNGVSKTKASEPLLLVAEQLFRAYPTFPQAILFHTDPHGGRSQGGPPPEQLTYWNSWIRTPDEVRYGSAFDRLWCLISMPRFAALMTRWGKDPCEALASFVESQRQVTAAASVSVSVPVNADCSETVPIVEMAAREKGVRESGSVSETNARQWEGDACSERGVSGDGAQCHARAAVAVVCPSSSYPPPPPLSTQAQHKQQSQEQSYQHSCIHVRGDDLQLLNRDGAAGEANYAASGCVGYPGQPLGSCTASSVAGVQTSPPPPTTAPTGATEAAETAAATGEGGASAHPYFSPRNLATASTAPPPLSRLDQYMVRQMSSFGRLDSRVCDSVAPQRPAPTSRPPSSSFSPHPPSSQQPQRSQSQSHVYACGSDSPAPRPPPLPVAGPLSSSLLSAQQQHHQHRRDVQPPASVSASASAMRLLRIASGLSPPHSSSPPGCYHADSRHKRGGGSASSRGDRNHDANARAAGKPGMARSPLRPPTQEREGRHRPQTHQQHHRHRSHHPDKSVHSAANNSTGIRTRHSPQHSSALTLVPSPMLNASAAANLLLSQHHTYFCSPTLPSDDDGVTEHTVIASGTGRSGRNRHHSSSGGGTGRSHARSYSNATTASAAAASAGGMGESLSSPSALSVLTSSIDGYDSRRAGRRRQRTEQRHSSAPGDILLSARGLTASTTTATRVTSSNGMMTAKMEGVAINSPGSGGNSSHTYLARGGSGVVAGWSYSRHSHPGSVDVVLPLTAHHISVASTPHNAGSSSFFSLWRRQRQGGGGGETPVHGRWSSLSTEAALTSLQRQPAPPSQLAPSSRPRRVARYGESNLDGHGSPLVMNTSTPASSVNHPIQCNNITQSIASSGTGAPNGRSPSYAATTVGLSSGSASGSMATAPLSTSAATAATAATVGEVPVPLAPQAVLPYNYANANGNGKNSSNDAVAFASVPPLSPSLSHPPPPPPHLSGASPGETAAAAAAYLLTAATRAAAAAVYMVEALSPVPPQGIRASGVDAAGAGSAGGGNVNSNSSSSAAISGSRSRLTVSASGLSSLAAGMGTDAGAHTAVAVSTWPTGFPPPPSTVNASITPAQSLAAAPGCSEALLSELESELPELLLSDQLSRPGQPSLTTTPTTATATAGGAEANNGRSIYASSRDTMAADAYVLHSTRGGSASLGSSSDSGCGTGGMLRRQVEQSRPMKESPPNVDPGVGPDARRGLMTAADAPVVCVSSPSAGRHVASVSSASAAAAIGYRVPLRLLQRSAATLIQAVVRGFLVRRQYRGHAHLNTKSTGSAATATAANSSYRAVVTNTLAPVVPTAPPPLAGFSLFTGRSRVHTALNQVPLYPVNPSTDGKTPSGVSTGVTVAAPCTAGRVHVNEPAPLQHLPVVGVVNHREAATVGSRTRTNNLAAHTGTLIASTVTVHHRGNQGSLASSSLCESSSSTNDSPGTFPAGAQSATARFPGGTNINHPSAVAAATAAATIAPSTSGGRGVASSTAGTSGNPFLTAALVPAPPRPVLPLQSDPSNSACSSIVASPHSRRCYGDDTVTGRPASRITATSGADSRAVSNTCVSATAPGGNVGSDDGSGVLLSASGIAPDLSVMAGASIATAAPLASVPSGSLRQQQELSQQQEQVHPPPQSHGHFPQYPRHHPSQGREDAKRDSRQMAPPECIAHARHPSDASRTTTKGATVPMTSEQPQSFSRMSCGRLGDLSSGSDSGRGSSVRRGERERVFAIHSTAAAAGTEAGSGTKGSMISAAAVSAAQSMLLRVWRGFSCRVALAQQYREQQQEALLDAPLRRMLLPPPPLPPAPAPPLQLALPQTTLTTCSMNDRSSAQEGDGEHVERGIGANGVTQDAMKTAASVYFTATTNATTSTLMQDLKPANLLLTPEASDIADGSESGAAAPLSRKAAVSAIHMPELRRACVLPQSGNDSRHTLGAAPVVTSGVDAATVEASVKPCPPHTAPAFPLSPSASVGRSVGRCTIAAAGTGASGTSSAAAVGGSVSLLSVASPRSVPTGDGGGGGGSGNGSLNPVGHALSSFTTNSANTASSSFTHAVRASPSAQSASGSSLHGYLSFDPNDGGDGGNLDSFTMSSHPRPGRPLAPSFQGIPLQPLREFSVIATVVSPPSPRVSFLSPDGSRTAPRSAERPLYTPTSPGIRLSTPQQRTKGAPLLSVMSATAVGGGGDGEHNQTLPSITRIGFSFPDSTTAATAGGGGRDSPQALGTPSTSFVAAAAERSKEAAKRYSYQARMHSPPPQSLTLRLDMDGSGEDDEREAPPSPAVGGGAQEQGLNTLKTSTAGDWSKPTGEEAGEDRFRKRLKARPTGAAGALTISTTIHGATEDCEIIASTPVGVLPFTPLNDLANTAVTASVPTGRDDIFANPRSCSLPPDANAIGGGERSPMTPAPRGNAAAGAYMTPLEGDFMFPSVRSVSAYSSCPSSFSTTGHNRSSMGTMGSRSDFCLSITAGSIRRGSGGNDESKEVDGTDGYCIRNSAAAAACRGDVPDSGSSGPWVLHGIEMETSGDDETERSTDNDDNREGHKMYTGGRRRGGGAAKFSSDEDGDGGDADEDANHLEEERATFDEDLRRAADGLDKRFFAARDTLLCGEGASGTGRGPTTTEAVAVLQRVGRGYLTRRVLHFSFLLSISWAEVGVITRVAQGFLVRARLGLLYRATRIADAEMRAWDRRNEAAITLQRLARGFVARQRVLKIERKLNARLELRIAVEQPDTDDD